MLHHVEIVTDDVVTLYFLLSKFRDFSTADLSFKRWDRTKDNAVNHPDISVIDVSRLTWREAHRAINACTGDEIVLWGVAEEWLGLPVLPKYFTLQDLFPYLNGVDAGETVWASREPVVTSAPATAFGYQTYKSTIPCPL